jgi:hypothetical protein
MANRKKIKIVLHKTTETNAIDWFGDPRLIYYISESDIIYFEDREFFSFPQTYAFERKSEMISFIKFNYKLDEIKIIDGTKNIE